MADTQGSSNRKRHDTSPSPGRKRQRQKYTQKACVSCRRSKLKCSGEVPCQRCINSNKRCFYSEDQTAAEVLQFLSRPGSTQRETFATPGAASASSASRSSVALERRGSDASALSSTMEGRMVRMEIMMEALIRDRGLAMTPSREPDHDEHAGNRASSASDVPLPLLDRIHPALIDLGQQASATPLPSQIGEATPPTNSTYHIRVGERLVRFPKPEAYTEYMATFFGDIHLRYPCLDHDEFTTRTKCLLESGDIPYADKHLVALNLIIFACCDIMYGLSTTDERLQHGRHWFDEAQTLINHAEFLGGSADLVLAQYLLFQSIYLAFADLPSMAFNSVRLACTAALNNNLHNQAAWAVSNPTQIFWRMCLLWNVFVVDRKISLSCGRPPSLHFKDLNLQFPSEYIDGVRALLQNPRATGLGQRRQSNHEDQSEIDIDDSMNFADQYLRRMVEWTRFTELYVDEVRKGRLPDESDRGTFQHAEEAMQSPLDIPHSTIYCFERHPLHSFMQMEMSVTPLIIGRGTLAARESDFCCATKFTQQVTLMERHLEKNQHKKQAPLSYRHFTTSATAAILMVLANKLLKRELTDFGYEGDLQRFDRYSCTLRNLAENLKYAQRVYGDLKRVIDIISTLKEAYDVLGEAKQNRHDWINLVRANGSLKVADILPYQTSTPRLRHNFEGIGPNGGPLSREVLWLF